MLIYADISEIMLSPSSHVSETGIIIKQREGLGWGAEAVFAASIYVSF